MPILKKMHSPKLTNRLAAVAACIKHGSRVADIGTDHAYIPTYAVAEGISPSAIASDIREGPAARARETVERYGLSDKIKVIVAPGLEGVGIEDADDIVIAGMGGETIIQILKVAPPFPHLVLQPQSDWPEVREHLAKCGYRFTERAVSEEEKLYLIIDAWLTEAPYTLTDFEGRVGNVTGAVAHYRKKLENAAKTRLEGLYKASDDKNELIQRDITLLKLLEDINDDC